jgi:DNA invertase Pin-like site-specific DNA recombinase
MNDTTLRSSVANEIARPHDIKSPTVVAVVGSPKIKPDHLARDAAVYIRQSSLHQLRDNRESTARQYQLHDRLLALGWRRDQIVIIDEDLGVSGSGSVKRDGFRRLLKLVTDHQLGIVIGLEMSRLARNSKDWHDLFEVCAVFDSLIADEDGLFCPNDPNDRMVLGLKGIISEMELHTMKVRLERGRMNKAERGELFHEMPVGFVPDEAGLPQLDPDESARHAMSTFFRLFDSLGSGSKLFHHLARNQIKLPFRDGTANSPGHDSAIDWRIPSKATVLELLKNPLYAGAYSYGRRKNYRNKHGRRMQQKFLPREQWKAFIKDRFPSYISWQQFEANQQRLDENNTRKGRKGAPRSGAALLAGIVFCGCCGRRITPIYTSATRGSYRCQQHRDRIAVKPCQSTIVCRALDDFVANKVLEALAPSTIELSLQAAEDESVRRRQLEKQLEYEVQRAEYEVNLAERRYRAVDPANRLVAGTLEQQWESALVGCQAASKKLAEFRSQCNVRLTEQERNQIKATCRDLAALWSNATHAERKEIVRLMVERVEVSIVGNSQSVTTKIRWSGGFESCYEISRPVQHFQQLDYHDDLLNRALGLALAGKTTSEVAATLQSEGFLSPRDRRPLSAGMVSLLLNKDPRSAKQLHNPDLGGDEWRARTLAAKLGIREKLLKHWVTRGWAHACQRPIARAWVIWADAEELERLQQLAASQAGQGSPLPPKELRTPRVKNRKNTEQND